ncbi:conserved membrane hypothetical protein [uncultured Paludibacter sp.]|uniref:Uncharacterized protein n=1 Tax=uncultured Paludibacter sp. TaxID=497635 RepID=A0A653AGE1_9BACT|nr:conserved membrane hypothetical protein [uncultured Paludibacter sp.]
MEETPNDSEAAYVDTNIKSDSVQLLPEHYLITQRLLWGEKGLMRNFDSFKLSETARDKEMDIRNTMINIHQYLGYATLISMVGNGIVGQKLYSGNRNVKDLHEGFAATTNVLYFSTATFSLFAPPPMKDRESGFTRLNIHKALSIIHLSSMIATNVLSGMIEDNPSLKPYHRAAAITAFGSLFLATVVIKL